MVLLFLKPVSPKRKIVNLPRVVELDRDLASVDDLIAAIHAATGLAKSRIRLFLSLSASPSSFSSDSGRMPPLELDPRTPLHEYDVHDGTRVYVRDIGPQVNRRTMMLTAYAGPLLAHWACYYLQFAVYGARFHHAPSQVLAFVLINVHFVKRMFETACVHVFDRPLASRASFLLSLMHYWVLSGIVMAYYVYAPHHHPLSSIANNSHPDAEETSLYFLSAIWIFAQLSNFETHLILANLRMRYPKPSLSSASSAATAAFMTSSRRLRRHHNRMVMASSSLALARRIPKGYGFDLVSCPNYFFELLAWTVIAFITRSRGSVIFLVASTVQLWRRAKRQHSRYKKEFGRHYPKFRKILIPYIK
ncbi:3-oxo-5-alpha-steroid 4-dehydrogenase-domain-containing protein [Lipomyces japonicus]|uniref:3-oxo-5-alpha-steroid 4-dehydrogenase-domain-containing protein n=1 Tax=Lipomyces japonicus TaxID=56871 RepID=UPI0034CE1758